MADQDELKAAIAGLEAQRSTLGDAIVEPALAALRKQLADLAPPPAKRSTEEERKLVTILFVDISGFTALAEKLDAEDVRDLINACFEHLVPAVQKYDGTVDKFIGDEIMALFGAPVAHENDPERALRAALEMMDAIDVFNRERGTELGLHVGINTGPVVAGKVGTEKRREYSVMGDAVNLAARLEDASPTGEIYVGPATFRQTSRLFDFEKLPSFNLKGKDQPVEIYRLIGLKSAPQLPRGLEGLRSPMVGRQRELEEIQSAFRELRRGSGGIFAVKGEAGLGKSRFVAEALQTLGSDAQWRQGRALSHTMGMSYWMARDVLMHLLGVTARMPQEKVENELRRSVEKSLPEKARDVFPYLARLLEIPLPADLEERVKYLNSEALQGRMLQAFRELVRARARETPLVLFWEDLHWCDPSSLNVLETLLPVTKEAPLLLLLAYRLENDQVQQLEEKVSAAYGEKFRSIDLVPLSRDQSIFLIRSLLNINAPKMMEIILDRGEGNPFFLEELLRSLLDAAVLVIEGGKVVATRAIESADVPETLQGVLAARIDRLTSETKRALQHAAVIGRIFQERVLALLDPEASETSERLPDSLEELRRREFIRSGQLAEEREYIFKHAITHAVAYNTLLKAHRRLLHRQVAEALEMLLPDRIDDLSATLGYHFERAEMPERALQFLRKAGERAQSTFANQEAIGFYRSAIAQGNLLRQRKEAAGVRAIVAGIHEALGDVLHLVGNAEEAKAAYTASRELLAREDRVGRSRLFRKVGSNYTIGRRYDEMARAFDAAEAELGEESGESDAEWWKEKVEIQLERMFLLYWQGLSDEISKLAEKQGALIEEKGSPAQRGKFFEMLGLSELTRARYVASEESLRLVQLAFSLIGKTTDLSQASHAHFVVGFVNLWRGNLEEAIQYCEGGLKLAERVGDLIVQARCLAYLTVAHRRAGHLEETKRTGERAIDLASQLGMVELRCHGQSQSSLACLAGREAVRRRSVRPGCPAVVARNERPVRF